MNSYPFLDSKLQPTTDAVLGDIVRPVRKNRIIDISASPFLPATELRLKLEHLLMAGELDSGLPILCDGVLAGLIPAPDLEYALDTLGDEEENTICLMTMDASTVIYDSENEDAEQVDFSRYIDPVSLVNLFNISGHTNLFMHRLQSPLMSIPLSIWFTNASPSWVFVTSASLRTGDMPAWYTRKRS
jgi:hypothetical protein